MTKSFWLRNLLQKFREIKQPQNIHLGEFQSDVYRDIVILCVGGGSKDEILESGA
jgi:hypothetical protein